MTYKLPVWSALALKESDTYVNIKDVPSEVSEFICTSSCLNPSVTNKSHIACVLFMMKHTPGHAKIATICASFGYSDLLSYHLRNGGRYKRTDIYRASKNSHCECVDILAKFPWDMDDISYEIHGEEAMKNSLQRCDYEMLVRIIKYGIYTIKLNDLSFLFAYPSNSKQVLFAKNVICNVIKMSLDDSRVDISFAVNHKKFDNLRFIKASGIPAINTVREIPREFTPDDLSILQELYPINITATQITAVSCNGNFELLRYMYSTLGIKLPPYIILKSFDRYVHENDVDVKTDILKCIKFCHERGIGTDELPGYRNVYRWKGSVLRERLKRLGVI